MRGEVKARKGLIRVVLSVEKGVIREARVSGDFMMHPEDALWRLEESLRGVRATEEGVRRAVEEALRGVVLVGSSVDDFVRAVMAAVGGA